MNDALRLKIDIISVQVAENIFNNKINDINAVLETLDKTLQDISILTNRTLI